MRKFWKSLISNKQWCLASRSTLKISRKLIRNYWRTLLNGVEGSIFPITNQGKSLKSNRLTTSRSCWACLTIKHLWIKYARSSKKATAAYLAKLSSLLADRPQSMYSMRFAKSRNKESSGSQIFTALRNQLNKQMDTKLQEEYSWINSRNKEINLESMEETSRK